MAKIGITAIILFIFSQISLFIPGFDVPITMQTVAVTALPIIWRKQAFYGVLLYLIVGALGMPVFSDYSSGFDVFVGKTGGFLFGFALAAWLISKYAILNIKWAKQFLLMLLGHIIIIVCGLVFIKTNFDPNYSIFEFLKKFGSAIGIKLILGLIIIKCNAVISKMLYSNK